MSLVEFEPRAVVLFFDSSDLSNTHQLLRARRGHYQNHFRVIAAKTQLWRLQNALGLGLQKWRLLRSHRLPIEHLAIARWDAKIPSWSSCEGTLYTFCISGDGGTSTHNTSESSAIVVGFRARKIHFLVWTSSEPFLSTTAYFRLSPTRHRSRHSRTFRNEILGHDETLLLLCCNSYVEHCIVIRPLSLSC